MADSLSHIAARVPVNRDTALQLSGSDDFNQPKGLLDPPAMFPKQEVDRAVANGLKDLRGQSFGQLQVISVAVEPGQRGLDWVCRCACNRYELVSRKRLERGVVRRCSECQTAAEMREGRYTGLPRGPWRRPAPGEANAVAPKVRTAKVEEMPAWKSLRDSVCPSIRRRPAEGHADLSGRDFGRLQCVGQSTHERGGRGKDLLWACRCECGSFVLRTRNSLHAGTAEVCTVCVASDKARGIAPPRMIQTGVSPSRQCGGTKPQSPSMALSQQERSSSYWGDPEPDF